MQFYSLLVIVSVGIRCIRAFKRWTKVFPPRPSRGTRLHAHAHNSNQLNVPHNRAALLRHGVALLFHAPATSLRLKLRADPKHSCTSAGWPPQQGRACAGMSALALKRCLLQPESHFFHSHLFPAFILSVREAPFRGRLLYQTTA